MLNRFITILSILILSISKNSFWIITLWPKLSYDYNIFFILIKVLLIVIMKITTTIHFVITSQMLTMNWFHMKTVLVNLEKATIAVELVEIELVAMI